MRAHFLIRCNQASILGSLLKADVGKFDRATNYSGASTPAELIELQKVPSKRDLTVHFSVSLHTAANTFEHLWSPVGHRLLLIGFKPQTPVVYAQTCLF